MDSSFTMVSLLTSYGAFHLLFGVTLRKEKHRFSIINMTLLFVCILFDSCSKCKYHGI